MSICDGQIVVDNNGVFSGLVEETSNASDKCPNIWVFDSLPD